jgi:hypothetical protein
MFHRPDKINNPLHVITVIFNPHRYRSRWSLYKKFEKQIEDAGATLWTVEAAFGEREFAITESNHPRHIQFRTAHELWHKENLINLAISRLPADCKYVAWVDADVRFVRPDWVGETLHKLQHFHFVQMFSECQDLDSAYESFKRHKGFGYSYHNGYKKTQNPSYCYAKPQPEKKLFETWHPGFAWAARREAIDAVGGLLDFAILGSGDNHMAKALVGDAKLSLHPKLHPNYKRMVLEWEKRAEQHIRRNVGYVEGLILHNWHGSKRNRRYRDRWQILVEHQFDPLVDLKRDWQGLWQLTERSMGLRDGIRKYFAQRNEDSIDLCDDERQM